MSVPSYPENVATLCQFEQSFRIKYEYFEYL